METNNGRLIEKPMDWMHQNLSDWKEVYNESGDLVSYDHEVVGGTEHYDPDTGERTGIDVDE